MMLIMTRRVGEALLIGDDISLIILGVKGNQVRIGVEHPNDIEVHREELYNPRVDQSTNENIDKSTDETTADTTKEDKP